MNYLYSALTAAEYDRVSSYHTAKEISDTLTSIYEGTSQVQGTRRNILIGELESFKMLETENISSMFDRFLKITNTLKGLGEAISESSR